MGPLQTVPDQVVLSRGSPAARHEQVEQEVHCEQQVDYVQDLGQGRTTMVRESESFRLTR